LPRVALVGIAGVDGDVGVTGVVGTVGVTGVVGTVGVVGVTGVVGVVGFEYVPPPEVEVGPEEATTGATGVTELEAELALPVPATFVAVTVNVYAVPSVNPVMV
jgi:hypothetical protein